MNQGERHPRVRVGGIAIHEGRLLLVRHEKDGRTYWLLPGGGVEYGEGLTDALRREFQEEVDLDIEVGDLVMAVDSIAPGGERHVLNLCFEVPSFTGEIRTGGDPRVVEAKFFPLQDVTSITLHPTINDELVAGISGGFKGKRYIGVRWRDDVGGEPKS